MNSKYEVDYTEYNKEKRRIIDEMGDRLYFNKEDIDKLDKASNKCFISNLINGIEKDCLEYNKQNNIKSK